MTNRAQYEYHVNTVVDSHRLVNHAMNTWAEAGWELVSGTAVSWVGKVPPATAPMRHISYITYWRRPLRV
jgi:hypothetical protein